MNKNHLSKNYVIHYLKINFIPFFLIILLGAIIEFYGHPFLINGNSLWEILLTIYIFLLIPIVFPSYLLYKNTQLAISSNNKNIFPEVLLIVILVSTAIFLQYVVWGIISNLLFHPDGETIALLKLEFYAALIVIFLGYLISSVVLYFTNRKN